MKYLFFLCSLICIAVIFHSCAAAPAKQTPEERAGLKTQLIEGEKIEHANSCSMYSSLGFFGLGKPKFGSLYLTNLRLIYEESEWAKALRTVAELVPTSGDFGLLQVVSGGKKAFNSYFIITRGREGKLRLVQKEGRIFIPLSDIKDITMVKSSSVLMRLMPERYNRDRWIEINTHSGVKLIFEIYDLPPDKTRVNPVYISSDWMDEILRMKESTYGSNN